MVEDGQLWALLAVRPDSDGVPQAGNPEMAVEGRSGQLEKTDSLHGWFYIESNVVCECLCANYI